MRLEAAAAEAARLAAGAARRVKRVWRAEREACAAAAAAGAELEELAAEEGYRVAAADTHLDGMASLAAAPVGVVVGTFSSL